MDEVIALDKRLNHFRRMNYRLNGPMMPMGDVGRVIHELEARLRTLLAKLPGHLNPALKSLQR